MNRTVRSHEKVAVLSACGGRTELGFIELEDARVVDATIDVDADAMVPLDGTADVRVPVDEADAATVLPCESVCATDTPTDGGSTCNGWYHCASAPHPDGGVTLYGPGTCTCAPIGIPSVPPAVVKPAGWRPDGGSEARICGR